MGYITIPYYNDPLGRIVIEGYYCTFQAVRKACFRTEKLAPGLKSLLSDFAYAKELDPPNKLNDIGS